MRNAVIHTPRKSDYIELVRYLLDIGIRWVCSLEINSWYWEDYQDTTCIHIEDNTIFFADCEFYINRGFPILSTEEFYNRCKCEKLLQEFI